MDSGISMLGAWYTVGCTMLYHPIPWYKRTGWTVGLAVHPVLIYHGTEWHSMVQHERVSATEPDVCIGVGKSDTKSLANSVGKGVLTICLSMMETFGRNMVSLFSSNKVILR